MQPHGLGCSGMMVPPILQTWRLRHREVKQQVPSPQHWVVANALPISPVSWCSTLLLLLPSKTGPGCPGAEEPWQMPVLPAHWSKQLCSNTPAQFPTAQGNIHIPHPGLRSSLKPISPPSSSTTPSHMPLLPPHLPTHPSLGSPDFSEPSTGCPDSVPTTDHVISATGWRGRADVDRSPPTSGWQSRAAQNKQINQHLPHCVHGTPTSWETLRTIFPPKSPLNETTGMMYWVFVSQALRRVFCTQCCILSSQQSWKVGSTLFPLNHKWGNCSSEGLVSFPMVTKARKRRTRIQNPACALIMRDDLCLICCTVPWGNSRCN